MSLTSSRALIGISTLPPELHHRILEEACSGSYPREISSILRNSSLVCQNWALVAQPLLFSETSIARYAQRNRSHSLLPALSKRPHLRSYIKSIWIEHHTSAWIEPEYIDLLLELLPGLQELAFGFANSPFSDIPQAIATALPSTFDSGVLTALYLTNTKDFPVTLLYHCSALQGLYIHNSTFAGINPETGLSDGVQRKPYHKRCLRCLSLHIKYDAQSDILTWLTNPDCPFDLSSLKTLDVNKIPRTLAPLSLHRLYHTVSSSLEELKWFIPLESCHASTTFNIPSRFTQLSRLSLSVHEFGRPDNMFVAVATLLSNLSNPGQLQEVYIAVLVSIPVPSRMDHIQTNWKAISHRLSSPAFHKLRTVCIGLGTSYENMDQIIEQLKGLLQSMFRGLDERGILKFIDSEYPSLISHHDCWYRTSLPAAKTSTKSYR